MQKIISAFGVFDFKQIKVKKKLSTLSQLEERLGYKFNDQSFIDRALTHRSWAHEAVPFGVDEEVRQLHNEALEFVGDSILGCIVAEYLFRTYPAMTEGELSRMKHRLVSANTLAKASERLQLGEFMRVGRGEEKTGGRKKQALLADAFEAVLAAIFFDGGFQAAQSFLYMALSEELKEANPQSAAAADYKTMLQECLQANGKDTPRYAVVETIGPPHKRTFRVEVSWQGGNARGEGSTIKSAEISAARHASEMLSLLDKKNN